MDANRLLSKLALKGVSVPTFASTLGFAKTTIYRKVKGKSEFSNSEMAKIAKFLELTPNEIEQIFFN